MAPLCTYATLQNLIPYFPSIGSPNLQPWCNPRKGLDQILLYLAILTFLPVWHHRPDRARLGDGLPALCALVAVPAVPLAALASGLLADRGVVPVELLLLGVRMVSDVVPWG